MPTILLVEDEDSFRRTLARHLSRGGARVLEAGSCAEAAQILEDDPVDVVVTDVILPDGRGFEVMDHITERRGEAGVIVMTGDTALDHAITAMRHGANDFLVKPFSFEALDNALARLAGATKYDSTPPASRTDLAAWRETYAPNIVGENDSLLTVFDMVRRVADTDCSVLITGETGTGKELIARSLHQASHRSGGNFVAINCAAIPENLMESELFGHAKGAFTGATTAHKGRFAVADGGTLLLDEIGEMSLPLQAKLLRVLQEGEVRAVGENKAQKIDVRVIAATHRDVEEMADSGIFREDLLYRLDVIRIELPSLRDRQDDIPVLVDHFIRETAERRERNIEGIDEAALTALMRYRWPGNVRQLRHTVERMVILARHNRPFLTLDDVPARIREARAGDNGSEGADPILPEEGIDLRDAVERYENALILQALERTGWNKNQAANILQMNRTTLVEKLKKRGWRKSQFWAA